MLKTKVTVIKKAKYPVVDVHKHLGDGSRAKEIIEVMDACGVQTCVNLGVPLEINKLSSVLKKTDNAYPGRFLSFVALDWTDWEGIDEPGWSDRTAKKLKAAFEAGAKGLKFFKSLGLNVKHKDGSLLKIDDPILDPLWETCGKYKRPILIHISDPEAFFTPVDKYNERWHELNEHPNWSFYGDDFPTREELWNARNSVMAKHPNTLFIGAHTGNNPEDLVKISEWLEKYPNFMVEISARISEMGRQPYSARKFFIKYQDRILFGTDGFTDKDQFRVYFRFLESDDEYFDPNTEPFMQGYWYIYGLFLPDKVLEKVYYKNAEKYLFGLNGQ